MSILSKFKDFRVEKKMKKRQNKWFQIQGMIFCKEMSYANMTCSTLLNYQLLIPVRESSNRNHCVIYVVLSKIEYFMYF